MNNSLVIDFVYYVIERIALGFMCYIPFWNDLKIHRSIIRVAIPVGIIILSAVIAFADLENTLAIIFFCGFTLIFYILTIDAPLGKKMFVFMIVMNYSAIIFNTVLYFSYKLWPESYGVDYNWYEIIILCIVLIITFPILGVLIKTRIMPILFQPSPPSIWRLMWIIPAVFALSVLLISYITDAAMKSGNMFIIATLTLMIGAFTVYYFLLQLFNGLRNSAIMGERVKMIEIQLSRQHEQYLMIQKTVDRIKIMKHDMHHHLNMLYGMVRNREYEALEEHLTSYMDTVPDVEKRYCENHSIDAMLSYFDYISAKSGITLNMNVTCPTTTDPAFDSDISIIIGNLLENAIEAVSNLNKIEDKKIDMTCKVMSKYIVIKVKNKFGGYWKKTGDIFLSTKHEGYGLGIESIKNIVSQYGGTTEFNVDKDVFSASVIVEGIVSEE